MQKTVQKVRDKLVPFFVLLLLSCPSSSASVKPLINDQERSRLRYRLENLWNEVDLLVRNQGADRSDVKRQEREFEALEVPERIPYRLDSPMLEKALDASARECGLKLLSSRIVRRSPPGPRIPEMIFSDQKDLNLKPDQIVETISFEAVFQGQDAKLQECLSGWSQGIDTPEPPSPKIILEPTLSKGKNGLFVLQRTGKEAYRVTGRTYRFREVKLPSIRPRDPVQLLPAWARRDLEEFAQREPMLWDFVTKIRKKIPEALPLYRTREQFILNNLRFAFFKSRLKNDLRPHPSGY